MRAALQTLHEFAMYFMSMICQSSYEVVHILCTKIVSSILRAQYVEVDTKDENINK